ncbi:MAG TPA: CBS domain-containing protein [Burkholderiales bacterium]|nr:CBS domain-containing protein [Burkholderiales bacterium]
MKVSEAMSRDVRIASPDETICDAAKAMAAIDAGALPVGENNRLVGMITDRDIALRAVAERKGPDTPIRDVMTKDVKYCFEDEDLEHVASNMGDIRVRRLPVLDRDKRVVGIVSLGDIAMVGGRGAAGEAVTGVSRPGGPHSQTARA